MIGCSSRAVRRFLIEPQAFCRRAQGISTSVPNHDEERAQNRRQPLRSLPKRSRRDDPAHPYGDHEEVSYNPHPVLEIRDSQFISNLLPKRFSNHKNRAAQKFGDRHRVPTLDWVTSIPGDQFNLDRFKHTVQDTSDAVLGPRAPHPPQPSDDIPQQPPYGTDVPAESELDKAAYFARPRGQRLYNMPPPGDSVTKKAAPVNLPRGTELNSVPPPAPTPRLTGGRPATKRKEITPAKKTEAWSTNDGMSPEERLAFLRREENKEG